MQGLSPESGSSLGSVPKGLSSFLWVSGKNVVCTRADEGNLFVELHSELSHLYLDSCNGETRPGNQQMPTVTGFHSWSLQGPAVKTTRALLRWELICQASLCP